MQPEFISRISIPASFKKPPSIPISPNSFSIRTTCCPFSYGGSSIVTLFAAMGVVSGIKKRSRPEWLIN